MWRCLCDCGRYTVVMSTNLGRKAKGTQSCGCLHRDVTASKDPWLAEFRYAQHQRYRQHKTGQKQPWTLTIEQYQALVTGNCRYCGAEPAQPCKAVGVRKNGIDRVDSSIGYHADNCVPCCTTCNLMKGTRTVSEFIEHVRKISSFYVQ
jgi:hypothetical protein